MMTMTIAQLKDVATITFGQTAPTRREFADRGIPFVRVGSLEKLLGGMPESHLELVSDEIASKYRLKLYPRGSVLFARTGASTFKNRIYVLKDPAYVAAYIAVVLPHANADSQYLRHALSYFPLSALIKGSSHPTLSIADIREHTIPLPGIYDQVRIARILDRVEHMIGQRQMSINGMDRLLESVFISRFGNPVRNEMRWPQIRLSSLLESIETGINAKCEARESLPEEWGVLKLRSVADGIYKDHENKAFKNSLSQAEYEIKPGDLLLIRTGSAECMAACAYVFKTRPKLMLPYHMYRFVLKKKARMNPIFLWMLLNCKPQRKAVQSMIPIGSAVMPTLSKADLLKLDLILPPFNEQNRFAAIAEQWEEVNGRLQKNINDLRQLYRAISQKAFRGELNLAEMLVDPREHEDISTGLDTTTHAKGSFTNSSLVKVLRRFRRPVTMESVMEAFNPTGDLSLQEYESFKKTVFELLARKSLSQDYDEVTKTLVFNLRDRGVRL